MKKKLFILFIVIFSSFAKAQEVNCEEKEKQLNKYLTDNENKKALELWDEVKISCPSFSEKNYLLGSRILQDQIEIAETKDKESKVDALVELYNQYDKYFPNNKNGNYEKRAIALYTYKVGKPEALYSYLNQAFEKEKETFSNSQALYTYFEMYFAKYKENKSSISLDTLLDKYNEVSSLITANNRKFPFKKEE